MATVSAAHLGCRVAVKDRGEGLLCYYGATDFKPGLWCGVWLDQALVSPVQSSPVQSSAFRIE
jgi:dynactin complex subunit